MYNLHVSRSKTGLPVISESGGGMTNTGSAITIAGPNGEKLRPLFVPRGYSNGKHALFVLREGMHIVHAEHSRRGESVTISVVTAIGNDSDPDVVVSRVIAEYEDGDGNIPEFLLSAAYAASEKSHCYHCREAHYVV